jgi:hypothetical protein
VSDDLVKQALAELGDLVRCRCHAAYTDRKLHDPDCNCDSAEALQIVADRIEALDLAKVEALVRAAEMMVKAYREDNDQTITSFYTLEDALAAMKGGDT